MKRFAVITFALAVLSGFLLKGTFGHLMIVVCLVLFLGAPLALFLAAWGLIGIKRLGVIPDGLGRIFSISVILGGGLLLSGATGAAVNYWRIHQARAFVEAMVPKLDEYRMKHGRFPRRLEDLGVTHTPSLLVDPLGYAADADSFKFEYQDVSGMMDAFYFESSSRHWTAMD